jgi:hypothetical protein
MDALTSGAAPPGLVATLAGLSSAGTPWLAVVPASALGPRRDAAWAKGAVVIDPADPDTLPLTFSPLEPEPGYPVLAHGDRLIALLEAVFRPPEHALAVVRLALRQVYDDCGWIEGQARPSGPAPGIAQLRAAALGAAAGLGYTGGALAAVRAFVDGRLGLLWSGQARRFLHGGHRGDTSYLLRTNTVFTIGDAQDEQASAFLTGVLLIRVAEHLRVARPAAAGCAVVVACTGTANRAARWTGRVLAEIAAQGTDVISVAPQPASASEADGRGEPPAPALRGRRPAACGEQCGLRPCSEYELAEAERLARSPEQAPLRTWGQVLVLAFVTGRPWPDVPASLRRRWPLVSARTRECVLAIVIHDAVAARAPALRASYDPADLAAAVAAMAGRLLGGPALPYSRGGQIWVIPQVRWLHEVDRLQPGGVPCRDDLAPPLDYGLAGLPDWPGMRVGERLDRLHDHRLSARHARNFDLARIALLGEPGSGRDEEASVLTGAADLPGWHPPDWLATVLSWVGGARTRAPDSIGPR